MDVRFWIDQNTGEPHILRHGVSEHEAIEVLSRPMQELAGRNGAIVCLGQTTAGRYLGVVNVPDSRRGSVFVITGYELGPKALKALRRHLKMDEAMSDNPYPPGWDEKKIREVAEHYDQLSDEEAAAEIERAYEDTRTTVMHIPIELVPAVRKLLAGRGNAA